VGSVSQQSLAASACPGPNIIRQKLGMYDVADLAAWEKEARRCHISVAEHMDVGSEASATAAYSVIGTLISLHSFAFQVNHELLGTWSNRSFAGRIDLAVVPRSEVHSSDLTECSTVPSDLEAMMDRPPKLEALGRTSLG